MNQAAIDNEAMLNLLGQPVPQPKGQKQVMGQYASALQAPDPVAVPKLDGAQKLPDPMRVGGQPTSNTMPIGVGAGWPEVSPAAPVREPPSDAPRGMSAVASLLGGTGAPPITTMGAQKQSTSDAPVPPPAPSTTGVQPFQGFTPKHAMEGFDFAREQNPAKSAKDAFAFYANQAPPPPLNDKAALGAWFKQYIEPGMNALGHQVISVDGDKFRFKNWQGEFDVDFGRGAGAEGGALAWQVDDGTAQQSGGAYQPSGLGPAMAGGGGGESAMDRILAEVQALQGGGASPMDQQALLELLRA